MSTAKDNLPNLRFLLRQLKQDAVGAIKSCQVGYATVERTSNERIYDVIGFIAAFVSHLRATQGDMRSFLRHEYWEDKPHDPRAKNIVILSSMYVVGAIESKGALYQQAQTYARVVNYFLAAETDPVDIPVLLKRKTIYRLIDEINASRDQKGSAAADEPAERQAQAKGTKRDDAVRASSRDNEVDVSSDEEEVIDIDEGDADEAKAHDLAPVVDEDASTANTISDDEDDDLLKDIPDPKQERREWEKALITRARAAWSEGYEVLLVLTLKQPFHELVQRRDRGRIALMCDYEYQAAEDWVALQGLQIKPL